MQRFFKNKHYVGSLIIICVGIIGYNLPRLQTSQVSQRQIASNNQDCPAKEKARQEINQIHKDFSDNHHRCENTVSQQVTSCNVAGLSLGDAGKPAVIQCNMLANGQYQKCLAKEYDTLFAQLDKKVGSACNERNQVIDEAHNNFSASIKMCQQECVTKLTSCNVVGSLIGDGGKPAYIMCLLTANVQCQDCTGRAYKAFFKTLDQDLDKFVKVETNHSNQESNKWHW